MAYNLKQKPNTKESIEFNFASMDFFSSEIIVNGYLTTPYNKGDFTFTNPITPGTWYPVNISIYQQIHQTYDPATTADGEIVFGLSKNPGGTPTMFACFFLISNNSDDTSNDIDKILYLYKKANSITNITITPNLAIPKQTGPCVYYQDKDKNHVLVFSTPITINATTAGFINDSKNPYNNFSKLPFSGYSSSTGGPVKGYETVTSVKQHQEDEIYIDCSPTGASEKDIATYNLPMNSEIMNSKVKMDSMQTVLIVVLIVVFGLIGFIGGPWSYKTFIIKPTSLFFKGKTASSFAKRIKTVEFCILIVLLIIWLINFGIGWSNNDNVFLISFSLCYGVLLFIMYWIISNARSNYDFVDDSIKDLFGTDKIEKDKFNDTWKEEITKYSVPFFYINGNDLSEFLTNVFYDYLYEGRKWVFFAGVFVAFFVGALIYGGTTGTMTETWNNHYSWVVLFITYVIVSLVLILRLKPEKEEEEEKEEEKEEKEEEEEEEEEVEEEEEEEEE